MLTKPKFNMLDDLLNDSKGGSTSTGSSASPLDRETFDGKTFVRWFVHTLVEDNYLKVLVSKVCS